MTYECIFTALILPFFFHSTGHVKNHRKFKRKSRTRQWSPANILSDVEVLKPSITSQQFLVSNNKTSNTRGKNGHRRTKRFLSYPRFVEVMVVADSLMVAYHGSNLQHYILTLMTIVSIKIRIDKKEKSH